jgi:hypothetical protein
VGGGGWEGGGVFTAKALSLPSAFLCEEEEVSEEEGR